MGNFDNIIGHEGIKTELLRFADVIKNYEKYSALGVQIPNGIVLYGEPGVGKTLMAKGFIAEAGCKSYTIRKDMPNGEFVKYIKKTFDEAKKATPAIVFLDDMDKFANEDEDHKNAEEYVAVQSCIDDCKGLGVVTLATVNEIHNLPDSLLREGRFDKRIGVDTPNGKDGKRIIEYYLGKKQVDENVDLEELALIMEGKSCAFLETVINEAGIYAGYKNKKKLSHDDIVKAFLRMDAQIPECLEESDCSNLRIIAVHEAGHAVVREILEPGSVTLVSVYKQEYSDEGIVKVHQPDQYNYIMDHQKNDVMGTLGGKAASEVVFLKPDMGCCADLRRAFGLVSGFIDELCELGFNAYEYSESSQHLLTNKNILVSTEIDKYYQQAKHILMEHRDFLDAVVDALLDHKTITYREMQRIRESFVG